MAEGLFLCLTKVKISLLEIKTYQLAKEFITPLISLLLDYVEAMTSCVICCTVA